MKDWLKKVESGRGRGVETCDMRPESIGQEEDITLGVNTCFRSVPLRYTEKPPRLSLRLSLQGPKTGA